MLQNTRGVVAFDAPQACLTLPRSSLSGHLQVPCTLQQCHHAVRPHVLSHPELLNLVASVHHDSDPCVDNQCSSLCIAIPCMAAAPNSLSMLSLIKLMECATQAKCLFSPLSDLTRVSGGASVKNTNNYACPGIAATHAQSV